MAGKLWRREELILALNLYLQIPFGKIHHNNPDIIHLSNLLDRTPSSISMRLSNFASVDPYHQERGISGLKGGIKQVQPIWDEFVDNQEELLFESERLLAELEKQSLEQKYPELITFTANLKGETKIREIKTRVNQNVFRKIVLVNYNSTCAVSGIDIPEMLIASHILPWSRNPKERLNPSNGICLSAHFDKAFDKGLITFDEQYRLVLSRQLSDYTTKVFFKIWFQNFEASLLMLPNKYVPTQNFLSWHRENIFR
jgi:putative restriction endonuclease